MAISQNFPNVRPSLNLNFARSKTLDPRITFERASVGTYVDENGLIKTAAADEARFDHDPATGESFGLLIEESRTNLITYSEDISNAAWAKTGSLAPITNNGAISPDGLQTADVPSDVSTKWGIYDATNGSWVLLQVYPFTVTTEWTRQSLTFTAPSGCVSVRFYVLRTQDDTSYVYDTVTVSAGITYTASAYYKLHTDGTTVLAWGAQLEVGSFATSYIPTSGSTVTRQPDIAQITGTNFSSWYNQPEGTWLCNFNYKGNNTSGSSSLYSTALDQNNRNWLRINYTTGTPDTIRQTINSGTNDSIITVDDNVLNKISQAYTSGEQSVYINGSLAIESTRGISTDHNTLDIGNVVWSKGNNTTIITGIINKLIYYPERLTNTQLQNLTK